MKNLLSVAVTPLEIVQQLAALAPTEEKPAGETQRPQQEKRSRPGADSQLGPLDLEKYLNHFGVPYNVKTRGNRTLYRLTTCLFDSAHGKNDAFIQQDASGLISYCCSHNSCKSNSKVNWAAARSIISKDTSITPFRRGYDPNWKPPANDRARPRAARPAASSPPSPAGEHAGGDPPSKQNAAKPFLFLTDRGRASFNPAFLAESMEEKFKPLLNEGKDFGGIFYQYKKSGVWEILPAAEIRQAALQALADHATTRRIGDTLGLLEDKTYRGTPEQLLPDPMWINLKNCMLHLPTMETAPHDAKYLSRVQLPVEYDPTAKCPTWIDSLALTFADDLAKADVLQEFFGYCLYPKIIFPCALFQIGSGANGKGTVQRVLETMLGRQNVSHISLQRMEEKFGPVELKDKLLNACGETAATPLEVTHFKQIAAADAVQAEVKYKQDVIFIPIAKHMISMNEFPGVKDKTDAFFRRLVVLEYKAKFLDKADDKELSQKLEAELNGVFMWALEGLKRVLVNQAITSPEVVLQAKKRFRARVNPVLMYVDEQCVLGDDKQCAPPSLYKDYQGWCEDAKINPMGKQRFYEQVLTNYSVTKYRVTGATTESFKGIGLKDGNFA